MISERFKRTVSEGEHFVKAQWTLCEWYVSMIGVESASECMNNGKVERFKDCVFTLLAFDMLLNTITVHSKLWPKFYFCLSSN